MKTPDEVIDDTIKRVSEIVWWARDLTKLTNTKWFSNGQDFVKHLVDKKGPFIEFVRPPARRKETFLEFAEKRKIDQTIAKAFVATVFNGDESGRLYEHQADAIDKIMMTSNRDAIVSVPTATGKTECFLVPILDYCAKSERDGLKALLIYPLKTLEVDQLNRIVRVLYEYNKNMERFEDRIQIGIWDGDTIESMPLLASKRDLEDFPMRGILCPICGSKLYVGRDDVARCEEHDKFYWIRVTRKSIKDNARDIDILITNPESLDFLLIRGDREVKNLVGEVGSLTDVKYIVFDEAHVWRGISGSHINLLTRRLRKFYTQNKPKVVLVSATIANPDSFAESILGTKDFDNVGFVPADLPVPSRFDFSKVEPCTFRDLCEVLLRVTTLAKNTLSTDYSYLEPASRMAAKLKLIELDESATLTVDGKRMIQLMERPPGAVEDVIDVTISHLTNSLEFIEFWQKKCEEGLPEVYALAAFFAKSPIPIVFKEADALCEDIVSTDRSISKDRAHEILPTLLSFGRSANVLIDKYHLFIKPLSEIYWCPKDHRISTGFTCDLCSGPTTPVHFCEQCHEPYIVVERSTLPSAPDQPIESPNGGDGKMDGAYEDDEESSPSEDGPDADTCIVSLDEYVSGNPRSVQRCIECGEDLYVEEMSISVFYTAFVSYIVSALCRNDNASKALVFSDARGVAERIGQNIVSLDYSLVAQQLYVQQLLNNVSHVGQVPDITFDVMRSLSHYYLDSLMTSLTEESESILSKFREENLNPMAFLSGTTHLWESSIITSLDLYEHMQSTVDLMIAHRVLTMFERMEAEIKPKGVPIYGLTWDVLVKEVKKEFPKIASEIEKRMPRVIESLLEAGITEIASQESLSNTIAEGITRKKPKPTSPDDLKSEIQQLMLHATETLAHALRKLRSREAIPSGLVRLKEFKKRKYGIILVPKNAICLRCYSVYPAHDEDIQRCPRCDGTLEYGSRIAGVSPLGYVKTSVDSEFSPIDHWGKDIVSVALKAQKTEIPHVVTWVHRAGIPSDVRGAIEDGFRRAIPTVNVISSTTTLELGIDIGSLDAVIQVGVPPTLTNYVQRSGRTGRVRGRPSYVITVIRNSHSVDMYYYNDLRNYFGVLKPINVPDPQKYHPVQAPHVVAEVCTYLARQMPPAQYSRIYSIDNERDIANFSSAVLLKLKMLARLVIDPSSPYRDKIRKHIEYVFGDVTVMNEVFQDGFPLSLSARAERVFMKLQGRRAREMAQPAQSEWTKKNGSLGMWLSTLGYLAAYRDMSGGYIPLVASDRRKGQFKIEVKSEEQVVTEAYPGEKNRSGAIFSVETVRFVVDHVIGGPHQLLETNICRNEECKLRYQTYSKSLVNCPVCDTPLDATKVFTVDEVVPLPAGRRSYNTFPITATDCRLLDQKGEGHGHSSVDHTIGTMPSTIKMGAISYVHFTPAFQKYGGSIKKPSIKPSEAEIRLDESGNGTASKEPDLMEFLQGTSDTHPKYPIGYQDLTEGFMISMDLGEVKKRISDDSSSLVSASFSFVQAIKRAVALVAQVEMQDFMVHWSLDEDSLKFYVLDSCSGGSGISRLVFADLSKKSSVFDGMIENTVNCRSGCKAFCDSCLLLERTPENLLRSGLLDRRILSKLLGM